MRNPTFTHLREAVRNEITQSFDCLGYAKPRDIAKLVCTAHPESIASIGAQLAEKVIFDGRNLFDLEVVKKHGFSYYSIGRQDIK